MKLLSAAMLAVAAFAQNDQVDDAVDSASYCLAPYSIIPSQGLIWDLSELGSETNTYINSYNQPWYWNFCKPIPGADGEGDEAYVTYGEGNEFENWGTEWWEDFTAITETDAEGNESVTGVSFTSYSDAVCDDSDTIMHHFTTYVTCVPQTTEEGAEPITTTRDGKVAHFTDERCHGYANYKGPAGCPTVDMSEKIDWLSENAWAVGIIFLLVAPFVGLFGERMFPYVVATVSSLTTLAIVFLLLAAVGCADTTAGVWISISVALCAAIAVGCLIRRQIKFMIGVVSTCGGVYGGILLFALCSAMFGLTEAWALWVFIILGGVAGFFAGYKLGTGVVRWCTAFIGAYLFTRALSCFFWTDHWPSESEAISGEIPEELGYQFWVFFGIMIVTTVLNIIFQTNKAGERHADMDEYEKM
jgi:hypothetical protein